MLSVVEISVYVFFSDIVNVIPYVTANALTTSVSILQVQNGQVRIVFRSPQETRHRKKWKELFAFEKLVGITKSH